MDSCLNYLISTNPDLASLVERRGRVHKYVADWVVRWGIKHGAPALKAAGWDGAPIFAGIGVLSLDGDKLKWEPTTREVPPLMMNPEHAPADAETKAKRLEICKACPSYNGVKCDAGCSCDGSGRPHIAKSKCPVFKW